MGIYCFDTARFLLGEEPIEIDALAYSTPGDKRFSEVDESVSWCMRFPSGAIATCITSLGTYGSNRYRVIGTKGWAQMDPAFSYHGLRLVRAGKPEAAGELDAYGLEDIADDEKDQFALELDHFADCIAGDRQPYTPGEEGVQDLRVIDAIFAAARGGRRVTLEPVKGLDAFRGPPPHD